MNNYNCPKCFKQMKFATALDIYHDVAESERFVEYYSFWCICGSELKINISNENQSIFYCLMKTYETFSLTKNYENICKYMKLLIFS